MRALATILLAASWATADPVTVTEDFVDHPWSAGSDALDIGVTNETSLTVEWFAIQTGYSLDFIASPDGWDYQLVWAEYQWTNPVSGHFQETQSVSWQDITGQSMGDFVDAAGFVDPYDAVMLLALPVDADGVHDPAAGLAPGDSVDGFLLEGAFGSPVAVGLSDGSTVYGHSNEPIEVGGGSTQPVPEPATGGLVLLAVAAFVYVRRRTCDDSSSFSR